MRGIRRLLKNTSLSPLSPYLLILHPKVKSPYLLKKLTKKADKYI
jgi:hypothetical protein